MDVLAFQDSVDIALSVATVIGFGLGGVAWLVRRIDALEDKLDNHMFQNSVDHQSAAADRAAMEGRIVEKLHDMDARLEILERFQCKVDR